MKRINLSISKDFSPTPGGRYKAEGDNSGEEFRDLLLFPKFKEAMEKKAKLMIDLDGCMGFPSSFLDESFGGLARKLNLQSDKILEIIEFKSDDQPSLVKEIEKIIQISVHGRG